MKKIAVIQPLIPSYRKEFFDSLSAQFDMDIFVYQDQATVDTYKLEKANLYVQSIKSYKLGSILYYNPFKIIKKDYNILILMLDFSHLTTWLLLLTKIIHRKKIILWGHAISVKRFSKETKNPDFKLKWMIYLSDCIWCYTENERLIWNNIFPNKNIISLNNTISGIDSILDLPLKDKKLLRIKYNIVQPRIFIYCARFNIKERRIDLLTDIINKLNPVEFGFIVIGDGKLKPNFESYSNVYDFGSLFDPIIKNELFQAADIYFQPAWLGLSIVEAMANGKPVFTFERNEDVLQCVEFNYIINNYNGVVFKNMKEFIDTISKFTEDNIKVLSNNSKDYAISYLSMGNMVSQATKSLKEFS